MLRYLLTIFLSAFLLFGVQPLISKVILPWFGGSPTVWTTCMLFFQVLLLAGYAYAHWAASHLSARVRTGVHLTLLAVSLAWLPIAPGAQWKPTAGGDPTWWIMGLLTASIGLPYAMLSATSPLLQRWFSLTHPGRSPYRLFALSNAGSLLALLAYPFLVEPALTVQHQLRIWSIAYAVFALLCGWCAIAARGAAEPADVPHPAAGDADAAADTPWLLCLTLSCCGSVLLLAVTNQICQNVAVVPFLWVLPLALYLLSFVLTFESDRWYVRRIWAVVLVFAMATATGLGRLGGARASLEVLVGAYGLVLFAGCMVLHGELVRLKPAPSKLTRFYLLVSVGGALGGVLVTLVAPRIFNDYLELPLVLIATPTLMAYAVWRDASSPLFGGARKPAWVAIGLGLALLVTAQLMTHIRRQREPIAIHRNFYGVMRVWERHPDNPLLHRYDLSHGWIRHGLQIVSQPDLPTTYFGEESAAGRVLRNHPRRGKGMHTGVIGLGAGTLAVYGEPGDRMRFYEIDPACEPIADKYFSFLRNCKAKVTHVLGDARLSMERELAEGSQRFDVLIIDAFSGDAVPAHLLTRECMAVYWQHLTADGVLLFHISNKFLDLRHVVLGMAQSQGVDALYLSNESKPEVAQFSSDWVIVPRQPALIYRPQIEPHGTWLAARKHMRPITWTDDYCPLFTVVRGRGKPKQPTPAKSR